MQQKFLLLFFVSVLICGQYAFAESEPNNDRNSANTLMLNGSDNGSLSPAGDQDWWKLITTNDGKISISLTPPAGQNVWIYLFDNDGTTLLNSTYSTATFTLNKDGLAAGTYYIRVNGYYGTETGAYSISNTLTSPTQANDVEQNGTKAQAKVLPVNATKTGHINYYYNTQKDSADWYKITTTSDGRIRLTMTSGNGQNVWAELFDNDGVTLLAGSYTTGTSFVVNKDALSAGTYYVRVRTYYGSEWAPYTLSDSVFYATESNDVEPNSTAAQALTLPLNGSKQGHVNYYYNNQKDGEDWYKITTTADGRLQLNMASGNGQNVWAELFDTDGSTYITGSYTTGNGTVVDIDGLKQGAYYVRVRTYYTSEWAPYTLSNTCTFYTNAGDAEPNELYSQAKTIPANGSVTGHISFYGSGSRDNVDIFKINYTGSGNMTINFNQENRLKIGSAPPTWMQVYKDTALAPIYSNYFYSTSGNINLTSLTQGYYYVKVFTYYTGNFTDFSSYSISNTFTQVNIANITITTATSNGCSNGQLQMTGGGSSAPYTVKLYRFGALYATYTTNLTSGFTASNLPPGIYYATAFGDGATGTAFGTSNTKSLLPPATTTTSETNIKSTAATVRYNSVSCANGYVVQWRKLGTTPWSQKIVLGNKDSLRISGLLAATTYQWRVAVGVGVDTFTNYVLSAFSAIDQFTTTSSLAIAANNYGSSTDMAVAKSSNISISAFPNPAVNVFRIVLKGAKEEQLSAMLLDAYGKWVWSASQVPSSALNNRMVDVSKLSVGIYTLQVINAAGMVSNTKIIVTR